jgi:hypothetical protein
MQVNISTTEEATIDSQLTSRLQQLRTYVQPQLDASIKFDQAQILKFVKKQGLVGMPMCWELYKWLRPYFKRFDSYIDGGGE